MNSNQFEMAILIAMAIFAIAAIGAVASIIRGRRRSWVQNLPTTRVSANPVRQMNRPESQAEFDRRTNYGMF